MPDDPLNINSMPAPGPFGSAMCCSGDSRWGGRALQTGLRYAIAVWQTLSCGRDPNALCYLKVAKEGVRFVCSPVTISEGGDDTPHIHVERHDPRYAGGNLPGLARQSCAFRDDRRGSEHVRSTRRRSIGMGRLYQRPQSRADPSERIVQSWRTSEFGDEHEDSVITVLLEQAGDDTVLTLEHSNVPDEHRSYEEGGWQSNYFEPMVAYFGERRGKAAEPARRGPAKSGAPKAAPKTAAEPRAKSAGRAKRAARRKTTSARQARKTTSARRARKSQSRRRGPRRRRKRTKPRARGKPARPCGAAQNSARASQAAASGAK